MKSVVRRSFKFIPLFVLLNLFLTGCAGSKLPEHPEDAIVAIQKKMNKAESYHADMELNINMDIAKETVKMDLESKMVIFTNPYKGKMTMDINPDTTNAEKTELYITKNKDHYLIYKGIDKEWSKEELEEETFEATYNTQADINVYIAEKESFIVKEQIEEEGRAIVVLEGKLTKDALHMIINNIDLSLKRSELNDTEDIPVILYVEEATSLPVRISIDLTKIMQDIMGSLIQELIVDIPDEEVISLQVTNSVMTINYSHINNAEDFEIPEEVKESE